MEHKTSHSLRFFGISAAFFFAMWMLFLVAALFPEVASAVTLALFPGILILLILFFVVWDEVRKIGVKEWPWFFLVTAAAVLIYILVKFFLLDKPESLGDAILILSLLPAYAFDYAVLTLRRLKST